MSNAIFYALYLPEYKDKYILDEFFDTILKYNIDKNTHIYVGIQNNSDFETENLLKLYKEYSGYQYIFYKRVSEFMKIDSDASSFLAALELYKEMNTPFHEFCYFVHSKGVTSGAHEIRKECMCLLFSKNLDYFNVHVNIGSYGPFFTVMRSKEVIAKTKVLKPFCPNIFKHEPMNYFFVYTFFVLKGILLKNFIDEVDSSFFKTRIEKYADRWLFERGFSNIADMQGFEPSFDYIIGNHDTGYNRPLNTEILKSYEEYTKQFK